MTIDRDDPERVHGFESDRSLAAWALNFAGSTLLQDGLPASAITPILIDAFNDYAIFRKAVPNPRAFLMERILTKARRYMLLRGIESDPREERPHLLEVIRTREALDTLGSDARRVVVMLFDQCKTFEEIAAELETTVGYVQRVAQKALQRLRVWRPQTRREW